MQQRTDKQNAFRQLMDNLEMMVQGASKVPFTNSHMIDRDRAIEIIRTAKEELPSVIVECEGIVKNQNAIISNANERAQHLQAEGSKISRKADGKDRAHMLILPGPERAAYL